MDTPALTDTDTDSHAGASDHPVHNSPAPGRSRSPVLNRLFARREALPFALLVAAILWFWSDNHTFLSLLNISGMLAYAPELGIMALGMTLLLTAGQFDLSVGSVFSFIPILVFIIANNLHVALTVAVLVGLAAAAVIGLINGILVTKFGITSFLVTLATQLILAGAAVYVTAGFPEATLAATHSAIEPLLVGTVNIGRLELYAGLFWFIGLALILDYVLRQTSFGNWILATGGNREAARSRGIRVDRVTIGLFILTAVLGGLAGTISDIRVGSAYPTAGQGYELQVIAMAVIGGTSLFGGSGTIVGTLIGVILLQAISNGVVLVGFPGLAYPMFVGAIILVAMLLQSGLRQINIGLERRRR